MTGPEFHGPVVPPTTGDRQRQVRVLIAEDDASLRRSIENAVTAAGHEAVTAADGAAACARLRQDPPVDLVLLDIGLPFVDGWRILQGLEGHRIPAVIVISARGGEHDKVRALDLGADDYLAKPFGTDELLARLRAVIRRARPPQESARVVVCGTVRVDLAARAVLRAGQEVRLSPTEWLLLAELARNQGATIDHRTLLQRVWGPQYASERNYLRTFVQRLRAKLEERPVRPEVIVTVGHQGYRFGPVPGARPFTT